MTETRTDRSLLADVSEGDRAALRELYTRHAPWLMFRLGRRCPDRGMVEEVVQDTFVAIWRGARSYSGAGEVAAWMWGIAPDRSLAGAAAGSRLVSDRLGGPAGAGAVALVAVTVALLPWADGIWTRTPGTRSSDASTLWWWAIIGLAAFGWWRSSVIPGLLSWRVRGGRREGTS